jgi:Family of unknown function (DUF6959)
MSTVGPVKTIEVEALTEQHNYAVIRLPARKFHGVVVQGDSLSILIADLRRALDCFRQGDLEDGVDEVAAVLESLDDVKRSYERVLAAHSISLPYLREIGSSERAAGLLRLGPRRRVAGE